MATPITGDNLDKTVVMLKAFAHTSRIQIANILLQGELNFGEIHSVIGTKQSHTFQQISILKLAGVLKSRRDGKKVYYSLATNGIKRIVKSIITEI